MSFQAEQALEVLGREVVRLRNQQREVLRVRRQQAKDKKMRAESRRLAYMSELNDCRRQYADVTATNEKLRNQVMALESTVKSMEETTSCLRSALATAEGTIATQREELLALQHQMSDVTNAKTQVEEDLRERGKRWSQKDDEMRTELQRKTLLVDVMQSAIEASEQRYVQ